MNTTQQTQAATMDKNKNTRVKRDITTDPMYAELGPTEQKLARLSCALHNALWEFNDTDAALTPAECCQGLLLETATWSRPEGFTGAEDLPDDFEATVLPLALTGTRGIYYIVTALFRAIAVAQRRYASGKRGE